MNGNVSKCSGVLSVGVTDDYSFEVSMAAIFVSRFYFCLFFLNSEKGQNFLSKKTLLGPKVPVLLPEIDFGTSRAAL